MTAKTQRSHPGLLAAKNLCLILILSYLFFILGFKFSHLHAYVRSASFQNQFVLRFRGFLKDGQKLKSLLLFFASSQDKNLFDLCLISQSLFLIVDAVSICILSETSGISPFQMQADLRKDLDRQF